MTLKLMTIFLMVFTLNAHSLENEIGNTIATFHKTVLENPEMKSSVFKEELSSKVEESLKRIRELHSDVLLDQEIAQERFLKTIVYRNSPNKFKSILKSGFEDIKKSNLIYLLSDALPNHAQKLVLRVNELSDIQIEAVLKTALLARSNIFGDSFDTFELSRIISLLFDTKKLSQESVDKSDKLLSMLVEKTIHKKFKKLGAAGPVSFAPAILFGTTETYVNSLLAYEATSAFPKLEDQMRNTISKFGYITTDTPLMVKKYLEAVHVSIKEKKKEIFMYMDALFYNDRLASSKLPSDFMTMANFRKYKIPENKIEETLEELEHIVSEKLPPYKPLATIENRKIQENYNKAITERSIQLEMALSRYTNCFDRVIRFFSN